MKYTTPTYEVEAVETVDVITASSLIVMNGTAINPDQAFIRDVIDTQTGTVAGKEVVVTDVNILL